VTLARTRSASAHQRVLNAAVELVAERGVDATSMDAIADCSGVSKATIYKHWPDKEALMLEMMAQMAGIHARPSLIRETRGRTCWQCWRIVLKKKVKRANESRRICWAIRREIRRLASMEEYGDESSKARTDALD